MESILLVFSNPDPELPENKKKWADLTKYIESASNMDATIKVLGKYVLLVPIGSTLTILQVCLERLRGWKYKYAIFPDGIEWKGTVLE